MEDNTEAEIAMESLSPEAKKTIMEWLKYLGKAMIAAIFSKLSTDIALREGETEE